MTSRALISLYWFPAAATLIIWFLTLVWGGPEALFTVFVLTLLEITFSADNAVVNSKILLNLSPAWQKLFLTVGIIFAVFIVRFALPILIVMFSARLGFAEVINLALHDARQYANYLVHAAPVINAFGGTFLLMITLSYFIDYEKQTHWLGWLEKRLGKLGRFDNITTFIMLLTAVLLYITVDTHYQATVLFAAIAAMALHNGLNLLDAMFDKTKSASKAIKTGMAGFAAFMYLQVLDASFSLDGVIGAFAITTSIFLIMAGLGAGAVWVRALTIHLTKAQTLTKYIFLEHGAHWAIGFLGAIMLLHLYHITLPEWLVGGLGLGFIGLAIWWSAHHAKNIKTILT